jgi:hypothetical protein
MHSWYHLMGWTNIYQTWPCSDHALHCFLIGTIHPFIA